MAALLKRSQFAPGLFEQPGLKKDANTHDNAFRQIPASKLNEIAGAPRLTNLTQQN